MKILVQWNSNASFIYGFATSTIPLAYGSLIVTSFYFDVFMHFELRWYAIGAVTILIEVLGLKWQWWLKLINVRGRRTRVWFHSSTSICKKSSRFSKKVSEYDQEIRITNCRQTNGTARKSHTAITRHHEDKLSKATIALSSPSRWLQKLEWT